MLDAVPVPFCIPRIGLLFRLFIDLKLWFRKLIYLGFPCKEVSEPVSLLSGLIVRNVMVVNIIGSRR